MGKHPWLTTGNSAEPIFRSAAMPSQLLVFPHGPPHQQAIEGAQDRVQGRRIETAVVLNPAPKNRIPHARQVIDGLVAPQMDTPASHLLSHLLGTLVAHRRCEVHEIPPPTVLRPARAKRVPQEVELLVGVPSPAVVILAVDDLRLLRMKLQSTELKTASNAFQDLLRLFLRSAVRDNIVRIPLERHFRMRLAHPVVEREMQEDIGHQGTHHSPYAKGNFQFERVLTGWRGSVLLDFRRKR